MSLPTEETLRVEFKSEATRPQSDSEIVENVVALANTEGGVLYLGVEDDGTVTGVSPKHSNVEGLSAFIFNRTVPQLAVRITPYRHNGMTVIGIEVDSSSQIVSTSDGKTLQRRLKADGTPEVLPLFPAQFISRLSRMRNYDYSIQPAPDGEMDDLDPVARNRLRAHIRTTNSNSSLLGLDDEDFDKALDIIVDTPYGPRPSVAGLLTIGRPEAIRRSLPTATAVIQVMQNNSPRVNTDPFALPLVDMFDHISTQLAPWNPNHEVMSGLLHMNVPDFDHAALREAMVNAFCHRDYAEMGSVRFLIDDDGMTIANPGGFIEGISEKTLLTAQPHSRNPQLALILKTAGFAERTGRGVDAIYAGSLAAGGSMPDYSQSTSNEVVLVLHRVTVDEPFITMVASEERRRGTPLSVWTLIVLSLLKEHHRLTLGQLRDFSNLEERRIVRAVEELVESGLVEATGNGSSRGYMLSSKVYRQSNSLASYARQANIDAARRNAVVLDFTERNDGAVTTADVMELLNLSYISAYRLVKKLESDGKLRRMGNGPSSRYTLTSD